MAPRLGNFNLLKQFRPARLLLLLVVVLVAVALLLGIRGQRGAWKMLDKTLRLQFQHPASHIPVPLDIQALQANFARLKEATRPHSGRYSHRLEQMMTRHVPVVNTSHWRLYSPSGESLTVDQMIALSLANLHQPGGFVVPNLAHIILPFSDNELKFHHMVSILSCLHVMKPHRLLLWHAPGKLPVGKWWDRVRKNLTDSDWDDRVVMAERPVATSSYNLPVNVIEHQTDVMRMEAVLTFGGFYLDTDVLVLKPLEPLRKFAFTIGRESSNGLCNGAFMSAPNGTFLAMWRTAYQVFDDNEWNQHSVQLPNSMHEAFPDLCHVEEDSMDRPNWTPMEVDWIYGRPGRWDWQSNNYVMHLWFRKYGKHHDMESVKTLDSVYGQVCRYILYGHK